MRLSSVIRLRPLLQILPRCASIDLLRARHDEQIDQRGGFKVVGIGAAVIICASVDNPKVKATCTVYGTKVAVSKVYFSSSDFLSPAIATYPSIFWSSSNPSAVTIDQNGNYTIAGVGVSTIKCASKDNSRAYATCRITVYKTAVKGITVKYNDAAINYKTVLKLAEGATDKGLSVTFNPESATYKTLVWTSNNTKVVTVDADGVLTAIGKGTATVTVYARDNTRAKLSFKVTVE